jgi:hypothetical protein
MFERIYQRPSIVAKHRDGPWAGERARRRIRRARRVRCIVRLGERRRVTCELASPFGPHVILRPTDHSSSR